MANIPFAPQNIEITDFPRQAGVAIGHIVALLFVLSVAAMSLLTMAKSIAPCADTFCGPF